MQFDMQKYLQDFDFFVVSLSWSDKKNCSTKILMIDLDFNKYPHSTNNEIILELFLGLIVVLNSWSNMCIIVLPKARFEWNVTPRK